MSNLTGAVLNHPDVHKILEHISILKMCHQEDYHYDNNNLHDVLDLEIYTNKEMLNKVLNSVYLSKENYEGILLKPLAGALGLAIKPLEKEGNYHTLELEYKYQNKDSKVIHIEDYNTVTSSNNPYRQYFEVYRPVKLTFTTSVMDIVRNFIDNEDVRDMNILTVTGNNAHYVGVDNLLNLLDLVQEDVTSIKIGYDTPSNVHHIVITLDTDETIDVITFTVDEHLVEVLDNLFIRTDRDKKWIINETLALTANKEFQLMQTFSTAMVLSDKEEELTMELEDKHMKPLSRLTTNVYDGIDEVFIALVLNSAIKYYINHNDYMYNERVLSNGDFSIYPTRIGRGYYREMEALGGVGNHFYLSETLLMLNNGVQDEEYVQQLQQALETLLVDENYILGIENWSVSTSIQSGTGNIVTLHGEGYRNYASSILAGDNELFKAGYIPKDAIVMHRFTGGDYSCTEVNTPTHRYLVESEYIKGMDYKFETYSEGIEWHTTGTLMGVEAYLEGLVLLERSCELEGMFPYLYKYGVTEEGNHTYSTGTVGDVLECYTGIGYKEGTVTLDFQKGYGVIEGYTEKGNQRVRLEVSTLNKDINYRVEKFKPNELLYNDIYPVIKLELQSKQRKLYVPINNKQGKEVFKKRVTKKLERKGLSKVVITEGDVVKGYKGACGGYMDFVSTLTTIEEGMVAIMVFDHNKATGYIEEGFILYNKETKKYMEL